MKSNFIAITIFALALTGCGTTNTKDMKPSPNNALSSTFWVLENLDGDTFYEIGNTEREIGFRLEPDNNRISGYGGCNSFMGNVSVSGSRVSFTEVGSTKMSCPGLSFDEVDILKVLELAKIYTINDGRLELRVKRKDEPLAIFRKSVGETDINAKFLVEKHWRLKTLNGNDVEMTEDQERQAYFTLKTEGNRMVGFGGCNNLMGSYKLGIGNRIRFSNTASTLMACEDSELENVFMEVFELADNYTLNGDELLLNEGKKAPLAAFEAVYFD